MTSSKFLEIFFGVIQKNKLLIIAATSFAAFFLLVRPVFAAEETTAQHSFLYSILWLALILIGAKIGSLVERFGQPIVLGELLVGVIFGNLALVGINYLEPIKTDEIIAFLAELGVIILLFQIGLESNIREMTKVGTKALAVAVVGVALPFILGSYIAGPFLLPGLSANAYIFIGATLTATSVGITARVFKDLHKLQTPEAKIVLGAAVIDDILGLLILAVVTALVTTGSVSTIEIGFIVLKAFAFLAGSIWLGQLFAPRISQLFSKIHSGVGMKFTVALSFCLLLAFFAQLIGLAAIVGAFAAGLILDPIHFRFFDNHSLVDEIRSATKNLKTATKRKIITLTDSYAHRHVEDLIEPIGLLFVPVFFVVTGMQVNLKTFLDPSIILVALGLTAVAFIGKVATGLVAGKTNKLLVGFGMVPRGEVGLIFANIGKAIGVINDSVFSVIVIMVILTTLLTPPILTYILKNHKSAHKSVSL